jgi:TatD DNase family protein
MTLVDSHAHVDSTEFDADRDAVWERARAAGIQRIVLIGLWREPGNFGAAVELAAQQPAWLWPTVGVHPHDAAKVPEADWAKLEELAKRSDVVGVGETGLDYHYMHSPKDAQRRGFERQLELAERLGKPVTIHLREADEDALAILKTSGIGARRGAVIHCFTGDASTAAKYLELGCLLSFSGIVTFKTAAALQEAARQTPLDRLLIETDAPFLAPIPHRGKRNEPAYVAFTAQKLAELKGVGVEELGTAAMANTERLFRPR